MTKPPTNVAIYLLYSPGYVHVDMYHVHPALTNVSSILIGPWAMPGDLT